MLRNDPPSKGTPPCNPFMDLVHLYALTRIGENGLEVTSSKLKCDQLDLISTACAANYVLIMYLF